MKDAMGRSSRCFPPRQTIGAHMNERPAIWTPQNDAMTGTLGRRELLKRGGAVAIARPLLAGGAALGWSNAALAVDIPYSAVSIRTDENFTFENQSWNMKLRRCVRKTDGQVDWVSTIKSTSGAADEICVKDWYENSTSGRKVSYFNSYVFQNYTLTVPTAVISAKDDFVHQDHDGGRALTNYNWNIPADATNRADLDELADYSNFCHILGVKYRTSAGVWVCKVVLELPNDLGGWGWSTIQQFSGADYLTFMEKYNALVTSVSAYRANYGASRTAVVLASTAYVVGAIGAAVSSWNTLTLLGTSAAAFGLAGYTFSVAQRNAMRDILLAHRNLAAWVESKTGLDLVA